MVRSLAQRGLPKWFAVVLSVLLAAFFLPVVSQPASAAGFQYTLEGCRLAAGHTLPNADGKFICTDAEYTTGNLGKSWNELDLVPHRATVSGSGEAQFVVAADREDAGHPGYDVLSAPVVNAALSDAGCSVTSGPESILTPGQGGADKSIYRVVTLQVPDGGTCVIDWYERLALGSHLYPGSSLHTNLLNTDFGTGGIGSKEVSIPVKEILPQKIEKTMDATQGSTYTWTVGKQASPTTVDFGDTCADSGVSRSADVTITVNWTRSARTAAGDVTLTTHVTATNPAHREITVNVTDKMYSGTTQANLLATNSGSFDVPAESTHVFEFTKTVSSTATTFNDVATATYTDKATGIAVPGNTTASATATVADNGQSTGASATISDVESITGAGFSYKVNSVTPAGGSFGTYTLGTNTTNNVTWSSSISPSGTGAASGSFAFSKTITAAAGTVGSGTLADTATLTPAGQSAQTANASVAITADAANPTLKFTKTVDLAPETDATFTFAVRAKDGNGDPTGPTYTFDVTIPAGQTSASSVVKTVAPSANGYVYTETAAAGYTGVSGSIKALGKCDVETVTVNNTRDLGKIKIQKVMQGPAAGASTSFIAHVDCPLTAYDQDVALNAGNNWINVTGDIPTGTQCTISEDTVPAGWGPVDIVPSTVTVSKGTPAAVQVVVTNKRLVGDITINKLRDGVVAGASTEFTVLLNCDVDAYDATVVLNSANSWTKTFEDVPSGVKCTVTEPTVPTGWELISISPPGEFTVTAGQTVTVNVTNKRLVGDITINKLRQGEVAGASSEFTVLLNCDVDAYDATVVLNSANSWTKTFEDVPSGVKCTVTEPTVPAGWEPVSISPPGEFTVTAGQTVTVNVTNKRLTGGYVVHKSLDGDVAGAGTDFTVTVNCDNDAFDRTIVLDEAHDWTVAVSGVPTGVACDVTETAIPTGWSLDTIEPSHFVIGTGPAVVVEVTNVRDVGKIKIEKIVQGDPTGASTDFTAHVTCSVEGYDQDVALNAGNGWVNVTGNIPTGVECTVSEPTVPTGWSFVGTDPEDGTVTVEKGTPAEVQLTVTNVRLTGVITVTKTLVGDVAGASTSFTFDVDCPGGAYDQALTIAVPSGSTSASATTSAIPTGLSCTVTERSTPGWSLTQTVPADGTAAVGGTVAFTNTRDTGVITVTKNLVGAANGASTTFTFSVECPGTAYDQTLSINVTNGTSGSATTKQIPTGLTCTVTEASVPDWKLTAVVPATGTAQAGGSVTFTNTRLAGTLNIVKAVTPVAGNGVVVEFGDTLTYTLTVSATGEQRQPNVVVTDLLPGRDPAHPASGKTTYVAGSAACIGTGTCTVSGPDASGKITWSLGEMAAGTTRQVTFKVTIDDVAGSPGEVVAVDILNGGAVRSDRVPTVLSNVVRTPVSKVLPVKIPRELPHTGTTLPIGPVVGGAVLLLGAGLLLLVAGRRRDGWAPRP